MEAEFQQLRVVVEGDQILATPVSEKFADPGIQEQIFKDFARLPTLEAKHIVLDLRAVKYFEGTIPGQLLRLSEAIKASGASLTVLAAPNICEVLQMLQLDRKFKVSESADLSSATELRFRSP